jgi:hypothetical protein
MDTPFLIPDPVRPPDDDEVELLRQRGVRLYEGPLPHYVLELVETGRLRQEAQPQGRYVVVADADAWDGEDLNEALIGED